MPIGIQGLIAGLDRANGMDIATSAQLTACRPEGWQARYFASGITGTAGVSAAPAKCRSHPCRPDRPRCSSDGRQLTRASHATGPEQKRHERKILGRLDDDSVKALRRRCVALLDVIDDFHQVGGSFLRPPNCLHGLCDALRVRSELWPWPRRVVGEAYRCAGLPRPGRETTGRSRPPVLWSRTRKRWGRARQSWNKD